MLSLDHHQLKLCTEYNTAANNYECGYNGMDRLSKLFNCRVKKDGDASHKCTTNKKAHNKVIGIKRKLEQVISKSASNSIIHLGQSVFQQCKEIQYNPEVNKHKLQVEGNNVPFHFHPTSNSTKKKKPRPQITETIMEDVGAYTIEPSTKEEDIRGERRDVFKVTFPEADEDGNEVNVYAIYAKRDSPDDKLRELHEAALGSNHKQLHKLIKSMVNKSWEDDHLGGGEYIPIGFGMEGHPKDENGLPLRKNGEPFTLRTLEYEEGHGINNIVAQIMHKTAQAILEYFPLVYHNNQQQRINPNVACPPLNKQNRLCNWFCTQYVIRQIGLGITGSTRWFRKQKEFEQLVEENNVSFHFDNGDVGCYQPLIYIPYGGPDGVGGKVNKTDIVICNHQTGGKSIRIKTNIPDTVAVVIFNSKMQVHGLVQGDDYSDANDLTAYSTRIVPFISGKAFEWMKKNPTALPLDRFGNYF